MADVDINKFTTQILREGATPSSPGFVVSEGQDPVNPPGTNNFVPYSGATSNVELGEFGLETGFINLDTTPTGTPTTQGTIFWDADDETVHIILNGYTMKIGEDLFYPVKNQTGSTIAKGVAVRFAGTLGASGRLLIEPFIANGTVPSSRFMGVTAEEILNGDDGKVLYFGRVRGINTDAFNEGDILYASTTVAGGYQTAIPLPPNNIVQVAAVISKSATVGTIFVRPTLGSNINTDEGVKITSVADKNLLQYQSGTSLWENKTLAQVLGGTSSQFVKGDGSLDSTSYQPLLTNPVTGTGTTNYLPKFTGASTIGNSNIQDSGSVVTISGTSAINGESRYNLIVSDNTAVASGNGGGIIFRGVFSGVSTVDAAGINTFKNNSTSGDFGYGLNLTTRANGGDLTSRLVITSGGNVLIGTTSDNGARLQVSGAANFVNTINPLILRSTNSTTMWTEYYYNTSTLSGYIGSGSGILSGANASDFIIRSESDLVFTSGGNNRRLTITSSGNVLIGTQDDVGARINVVGGVVRVKNADGDIGLDLQENGSAGLIRQRNNRPLLFYTNNAEAMRITSTGNVGIGTTSPSEKLEVNGTIAAIASSDPTFKVQGSDVNYQGRMRWNTTGNYLEFLTRYAGTYYTNTLVLDRGNVGIGTNTPADLLNIDGKASYPFIRINSSGNTTARYFKIGMTDALLHTIEAFGPSTALNFLTSGSERLRITSSGNVLIGTTTDGGQKLQVNGVIKSIVSSGGSAIISESTATSGEGQFIIYGKNSSGTTRSASFKYDNADLLRIGTSSAIDFRFETSDIERMRIASNGIISTHQYAYQGTLGFQFNSSGYAQIGINTNSVGSEVILINNLTSNGAASVLQYRTSGTIEGSLEGTSSGLAISNVSDYRKKTDIRTLNNSLTVINNLQPRIYKYKEGLGKPTDKDFVGFIAHEIQEILPDSVTGIKDGVYTQEDINNGAVGFNVGDPKYQTVSYTSNEIITYLVGAIQELKQEIDTLKN